MYPTMAAEEDATTTSRSFLTEHEPNNHDEEEGTLNAVFMGSPQMDASQHQSAARALNGNHSVETEPPMEDEEIEERKYFLFVY